MDALKYIMMNGDLRQHLGRVILVLTPPWITCLAYLCPASSVALERVTTRWNYCRVAKRWTELSSGGLVKCREVKGPGTLITGVVLRSDGWLRYTYGSFYSSRGPWCYSDIIQVSVCYLWFRVFGHIFSPQISTYLSAAALVSYTGEVSSRLFCITVSFFAIKLPPLQFKKIYMQKDGVRLRVEVYNP